MKRILLCSALVLGVAFVSQAQVTEQTKPSGQGKNQLNMYKDIRTGTPLSLRVDTVTGLVVNRETGRPVDFFVNAETGDTISAQGGYIVNNFLMLKDSSYTLDNTRVTQKGKQLWDVSGNKELQVDKGWKKGDKYAGKNSTDPARRDSL